MRSYWWLRVLCICVFIHALSAFEERSSCPNTLTCQHGTWSDKYCMCFCQSGWYGQTCNSQDPCVYNGPIVAQVSTKLPDCGQADGIANYTVNGGVAPFWFWIAGHWYYNPGPQWELEDIPTGNYTWIIRDYYGCNITSYTNFPENVINVTVNTVAESCNGVNDGSVTFSATGGSGNYEYQINGQNWTSQTDFENLTPGTYNYSVRDSGSCLDNGQFSIAAGPSLSIKASQIIMSCYSQNTGGINLLITGGPSPYTIYIDGGNMGSVANNAFSTMGLSKGAHSILVNDANSCVGKLNFTVPNYNEVQLQIVQQHDMCSASDSGSVTLSATGGSGNGYQYSVDSGALTSSNSISGLNAGQHSVTVTDNAQCTSPSAQFTINLLQTFTLGVSASLPWCPGGYSNLTISASGASNNYTYYVNGYAYSNNIVSVLAGTGAAVEVHDANGCPPVSTNYMIPDLPQLNMSTTVEPSGCSVPTGTLTANGTGGTSPYFFSLDGENYSNQSEFTSLVGGTYHLYVKDSHDCLASESVTIALQGTLFATPKITNLKCSNIPTGMISVDISGGQTPYTYFWNGTNVGGTDFIGLGEGTYSFDVQDSLNCVYHLSPVVTAPSPLVLDYNASNPKCNGDASGTITAIPSGGAGGYTYTLTPGGISGSQVFNNLPAAVYTLTVTDQNGCQTSVTVTLTDPESIQVTAEIIPSAWCSNTGVLIVNATGGSGDFEFSAFSSFSSNNTFDFLVGGSNVTVTVRDSNMCTESNAFTVTTYPQVAGQVLVLQGCDGTGTASFAPDNYNISDLQFSLDGVNYTSDDVFPNLSYLQTYSMYVEDIFQCATVFTFGFSALPAIQASATVVNATCFGWTNGQIHVSASGGSGPLTYSLNDGAFTSSPDFIGLGPGTYKIEVTDTLCSNTFYVAVYDTLPISLLSHSKPATCHNPQSGAIFITGSGGTSPFYYSLDGYSYSEESNFTGLSNGNFTFYVRDSNNCTASGSTTLQSKFPQASVKSSPATCASHGLVTFSPYLANCSYVYSVDEGNFSSSSNISMRYGNHTWRVMNNEDGCVITGSITVTQLASGCAELTTCNLTPEGPTCSECPGGYSGSGDTACSDIDECLNSTLNNCTAQQTCVNNNGSYSCLTPSVETHCGVNNGGCAYNVLCTQLTSSTVSCGSCPEGMEGDGKICISLCGNGVRDPNETCVSCPADYPPPCGLCGDGYCSGNETCTSCYADCGSCSQVCVEGCGNGECINGQCVCSGSWSGPTCSDNNQDMNMQVDPSSPSLSVTSYANSQQMNVSLSIISISEFSSSGDILRTYYISDYNFTYTAGNVGTNEQYNLSTVLENGAYMNVTIWLFKEQYTINFANTTTIYNPNALKMTVMIQNWPFMSTTNYLGVVTNSKNLDNSFTQVRASVDEEGYLKWLKIVINHKLAFYGQFLDKAVLDGFVRTIKFTLNNTDDTITTIIPHFWGYADIDPNFAVLLESSSSSSTTGSNDNGKGGVNKNLVIALPVTIGVVLVGAIFVCFAAPRIKTWMKVRKAYQNPSYRSRGSIELTMDGSTLTESPQL